MGVKRLATRTAVSGGRWTLGVLITTVVSALWGWWYDRPGMVKDKALEGLFERRAQYASAIFWPSFAIWLAAGAPRCPAFVAERLAPLGAFPLWAAGVSVFATIVLMRRVMASTGRGWPLMGIRGIWRASRRWLAHYRTLAAVLFLGTVALPVWWVTGDRGEQPLGHAIPVATLLVVGAVIAMREASWRSREDRLAPALAQVLKVAEGTVLNSTVLMPGPGQSLDLVAMPAAAVTHLDGVDQRVALHMPEFEVAERRNSSGAVTGLTFRPASPETLAQREILATFRELADSLRPAGTSTETRPDEHLLDLTDAVSETRADEIDNLAYVAHGLSLVRWDKGGRVAFLARLDPLTRAERLRFASHLPGTVRPWDLDIAIRADEQGRVDGVTLTRFPAITDPIKRREALMAAAKAAWPGADGFRWFLSDDPATDSATLSLREDPLRRAVPHPGLLDQCDPTALPVGLREDGQPFTHPVLGCHTLLIGSSGAGKGSVLWSLIAGLMPGVQAGWVEIHGIDLKGGVEFGFGSTAFDTLAFDPGAALDTLRNASVRLQARLEYMRLNGQRLHRPTKQEPLIFLVLDEAGALAMRLAKPEYDEAISLLQEILSQGRAAGVSVFAALQDPRKEAFKVRDLFTRQLALRLKSADETVMAIGRSLWEAGARCEEISPTQQGTGFSLAIDDADTSMTRFRAFWVSDEQVVAVTKRDKEGSAAPPALSPPAEPDATPEHEPAEAEVIDLGEIALSLDDLADLGDDEPIEPSKSRWEE